MQSRAAKVAQETDVDVADLERSELAEVAIKGKMARSTQWSMSL